MNQNHATVEEKRYRTTEAFISGGICGHMWWPDAMAGKPFRQGLRGPSGVMDRFSEPASFRDALLLILNEDGGDFQNAQFTADTRITVIRKQHVDRGHYNVHVFERTIDQLTDCADLVNEDAYTGDFMNDSE